MSLSFFSKTRISFLKLNLSFKILSLEEGRVSFSTSYGRVVVKGEGFTLNRLLENEVLISGRVDQVEVFYE